MLRWPTARQLQLLGSGVASRKGLDAFTQQYMRPLLLERLRQLASINLASDYPQLDSAQSAVARLSERIAELDRQPVSDWQPVLVEVPLDLHDTSTRFASSLSQISKEDPHDALDTLTAFALAEAGPAHGSFLVQNYASRLCSDALRAAALVTQQRHILAAVVAAEGAASWEERGSALHGAAAERTAYPEHGRGAAPSGAASAVHRAAPVRPLIESAIADAAAAVQKATGVLPSARFLPGTAHATTLRGSLPFAAGEALFAAMHASALLAVERGEPAPPIEVELGFARGSFGLRVSDAAGGIAPPDVYAAMRLGWNDGQAGAGPAGAGQKVEELSVSAEAESLQGGGGHCRRGSGTHAGHGGEDDASHRHVGDATARLARVLSPPMRSGLALARLHARYHGGGLAVCSHYGCGTHIYLTVDASGATGG